MYGNTSRRPTFCYGNLWQNIKKQHGGLAKASASARFHGGTLVTTTLSYTREIWAGENISCKTDLANMVTTQGQRHKNLYDICDVEPPPTSIGYGLEIRGSNPGGVERFSATVQTGPGAHPASCTMVTGQFPWRKQQRGDVDHPPHLAPRLKKE